MKKIMLLSVLIGQIFSGCKKAEQQAISGATPVLFKVTDPQKTANLTKADLFWYENGIRQRENDHTDDLDQRPFHLHYPATQGGGADSLHPLLFSTGLVNISGLKNVGTFYISYGSTLIDTISVTVHKITENGSDAYRLSTIQQNGISLALDTTVYNAGNSNYRVYILK